MKRKSLIASLLLGAVLPMAAEGNISSLGWDFSSGTFPEGFRASRVTDALPDQTAYKHGYTESGWCVELCGDSYIPVSPTWTGTDEKCENRLEFDTKVPEDKPYIYIRICSLYPDFPNKYRLEIREKEGEWKTLGTRTAPEWTGGLQCYFLEGYEGKDVEMAITASEGYMMALRDAFFIDEPFPVPAGMPAGFEWMRHDPWLKWNVVEKATAMWCNNCPKATVELEDYLSNFNGWCLELQTHVPGGIEVLANKEYWAGWHAYDIPRFRFNRGESTSKLSQLPTESEWTSDIRIEVTSASIEDSGDLKVQAKVETADNFVPRESAYRTAFLLTRDFYRPGCRSFYQSNNCLLPSARQYYFLPSSIKSELVKFHDVVLTSADAYTGVEGSLPQQLEAESSYESSWSTPLPNYTTVDGEELVDSFIGCKIVALIIDTADGSVVNASQTEISEELLSGVDEIKTDASACSSAADGLYTIDGIRVSEEKTLPAGIYVRVKSGRATKFIKK